MKERIYLSPPHLAGDEIALISDALQSNWIAPLGPHVDAFEEELANVLKVPYVITVNSGTSAIHLGLLALGVGTGDEVLCSTLTFCASVNPAIYCGAVPVFIDSEKDTWNIDPVLLEEAIIDRKRKTGKVPKAIIIVHLYGMPARLDEVMRISSTYNIPVLEDSAESLGSTYSGKALGTFGHMGISSFNGNKIITTSGGGALFSSDSKLIERAKYLRQEAKEPTPHYEHKEVGYNYRFSNILAALGRSQLKVLNDRVLKRRAIFDFYQKALGHIDSVSFQKEIKNGYSNRWLTGIIIRDHQVTSEHLRLALAAENIETRPLWKPMHLQPVFSSYPAYVNGVSEDLFYHGLCLPSGTAMEEDVMQRISVVIKNKLAA